MKLQSWWKDNSLYLLIGLLVLLSVLNTSLVWVRAAEVNEQQEILMEQQRPALLSVIGIEAPDCDNCPSSQEAIDSIRDLNVELRDEEILNPESSRAQELIRRYDIKKLPAVLITGETNKTVKLDNYLKSRGDEHDGDFIYTALSPPYHNLTTNKIAGEVSVTYVHDEDCELCISLESITQALKDAGVTVTEEKVLSYSSDEGKNAIRSFRLSAVPALLISDEVDAYPIKAEIAKLAPRHIRGHYAVQPMQPPYRSIDEDRVIGLAELVYLDDSSCDECYDVAVNGQIVKRFGVAITNEKTVDIDSSEGQELIDKYDIQKVPVIIMSPETQAYEGFMQVWKSVGSVEDDGWLVMRSPDPLGKYRDLSSGDVVTPK